jgi:hypothetical protein
VGSEFVGMVHIGSGGHTFHPLLRGRNGRSATIATILDYGQFMKLMCMYWW